MRVNEICNCSHKRKFHDEIVKPGELKGNPYGLRADAPYSKRYNHRCRFCKCNRFVLEQQGVKE